MTHKTPNFKLGTGVYELQMIIEYFLEWVSTAPVEKRVDMAGAMVRAYLNGEIEAEEREDLDAALTVLSADPSPLVRAALATGFGAHATAPRHILATLGSDVVEVSIIALSRSPVFFDGELVQHLKSGDFEKQVAISCRPWLSHQVVDAICEFACEEACIGILENPAAGFEPKNYHKIAERFGDNYEIRKALVKRPDLPAKTKMLLTSKLSDKLTSFVSGNNWLVSDRAKRLHGETCDRAAIQLATDLADEELFELVRDYIEQDRVTVSFLLRAVCMGNIPLVACVLSEFSGVKFSRIETIFAKGRTSAFRAIYNRSELPHSAFNIFETAIATWRELLTSNSKINQSRLPFLVTRAVLSAYETGKDPIVDELMVLLRRISSEAAHENAKSQVMEISQRSPEVVEQLSRYMASKDHEQYALPQPAPQCIASTRKPAALAIEPPKMQIHPSYVNGDGVERLPNTQPLAALPDPATDLNNPKLNDDSAIEAFLLLDIEAEKDIPALDALAYCAGTQAA